MNCRPSCGACCIVPAITIPFYLMPQGKAAGERCVHLGAQYQCLLFNDSRRPDCCAHFLAESLYCGNTRDEAIKLLWNLENNTLSN